MPQEQGLIQKPGEDKGKVRAEVELNLSERTVTVQVWRSLDVVPTVAIIPFHAWKDITAQLLAAEAKIEQGLG